MTTSTVRVHKIASVVYRLGFQKDLEVTARLEPRAGNTIVVRALSEKRVYSELELENGRMSKIFRGDIIVGALGRRRALRGFAGDVPKSLRVGDTVQLLNRGGVIGGSASVHMDLGAPVACEVLGMPVRGGEIVRLSDACFPPVKSLAGITLPPIVLVSGSCMESGKTLFLSEAIQELSKSGLAIAGGKVTGVACLRDLISMADHGAAVTASFLDAGHPSTAGIDADTRVTIAKTVISHLASPKPDMLLIELGDGIIGGYGVLDVLKDPEIRGAMRMHVFCSGDLVGAWGGQRFLAGHGLGIDLFSGPATDNAVGIEYLEREFKKPAINAHANPEAVAKAVIDHLKC